MSATEAAQHGSERSRVTILPHEDRRPLPVVVDGVWAGLSPSGVVLHLYVDYPALPTRWEATDDGMKVTEREDTFIREIVSTVIVSDEVADRMAGVLSRAASALRDAMAAADEGAEE